MHGNDPATLGPDFYRRMIAQVTDIAIIVLDTQANVVTWNQGAERITGYGEPEMVGTPITRLFPPEDLQQGQPQRELRRALDERSAICEGWRLRKNGTRFWMCGALTPLYAENGQLLGFSLIVRDTTERKQAEEKLARSNAEWEQFAAVVSHDLRSPLLAISGCAQLLREQYADALGGDGAELLGMVQDGVNRMALLIKDLLAFARATPAQAGFENVQTEEILARCLADLREPIAQSGAVVTHDPLPTVRANAVQLGQVLTNLIGNALKYHRDEPPRVHVSAADHGNEWEFSVRDNGIGIAPAHFEKIFGIFHRLHDEHEYGGGSGIGLAICKKIVEHHGGRIRIESRPGQGATFLFTLPKPA